MQDLFNPISEENSIVSDNNGKASIRKGAWRKALKTQNRDSEFDSLILEIGGLPKNEEYLLFKSTGLSDTGSIFKHIANQSNLDTLYLSTWIISRSNIEYLIKQIESGNLQKIVFIVSTRLKQLKKSDYAFLLEQFKLYPNQIFFKVCNSHAKTFSVNDFNGNYYTVTGSGNWTENPRIENYIILNDIFAFQHNQEWMTELI
jgi:hypothetical protein